MRSQEHSYAYHAPPPCACPMDGWKRWEIHQASELQEVIRQLENDMKGLGYPRKDRFAAGLVLREAVSNAIRHGHRGDAARTVLVTSHVGSDAVFLEIADEGPGFNPSLVADPLGQSVPRGLPCWGLLLMRIYMSWVRYNQRGNRVLLCKHRSVTTA